MSCTSLVLKEMTDGDLINIFEGKVPGRWMQALLGGASNRARGNRQKLMPGKFHLNMRKVFLHILYSAGDCTLDSRVPREVVKSHRRY